MKQNLKIAIYSGAIPSTTFIENLILGVSQTQQVYLFGAKRNEINYKSDNIKKIFNYRSKMPNLIVTFLRLFLLLFKYPKRFAIAFSELRKFQYIYAKFNHLSKIVGVLLYLPDVFHIQWAKDLEKWLFLKEKLDVKIILSLRGAHINYSPIKDKLLAASYLKNFNKVDGFHAVSKDIANEAEKYGAETKKIKVVHSILPKSLFKEFSTNVKPKKVVKILSVGRFHWVKGYRYALDAIKLLKESGVSVIYTIVATNDDNEEILFQIDQLDIKECVKIVNGLPQSEVFDLMKSSSILLLPSLNEGIANVVLEAMAVGLPVISTDCGGMSEIIAHKKSGWLVPVRHSESIANAIKDFINTSDSEIEYILQSANAIIEKEFNPNHNISKMISLYHSVM